MYTVKLHDPSALVDASWLERNLSDPNLRIFDCSTVLDFQTDDERPYRVVDCRSEHDAGHIPGAGYLDLQKDFSRQGSPYAMSLAAPDKVASSFEHAGIENSSTVVLYSRRSISWATRFWWMLRWIGFDRAAILDGGFERWQADGRPISTEPCTYTRGRLSMNLRSGLFVGKDDVRAAIGDNSCCTINALGQDIFSGENPRYGRPGRVPGSVNVPKISLVDPETMKFKAPEEIAELFSAVGAEQADRYITYCGGGIFATVVAYWLYQLGHDNIAVYDNSMSEWAMDPDLPMETG